jgi:hypothetical protein
MILLAGIFGLSEVGIGQRIAFIALLICTHIPRIGILVGLFLGGG